MFCIDVINQLVSALLVKATKPSMKHHLNMIKILNSLALCAIMLMCPAVHGQNRAQAALLEKAYHHKSEKLLFEFFDNWSKEISSNESEAPDKWVSEAHKVFVAFYQPLHEKFGRSIYQNNPYFIVQNSLWKILVADTIPYKPEELEGYYANRIRQLCPNDTDIIGNLRDYIDRRVKTVEFDNNSKRWDKIPTTMVDSNITFRPPVLFPEKKIVYLTDEYIKLLDKFLGNKHVEMGKYGIMQIAYAKKKSSRKMNFVTKAATIFYGHWGGYWQYETYPQANSIVIDTKMHRAVVYFRFIYGGGYVVLEKQNDDWEIMKIEYNWVE